MSSGRQKSMSNNHINQSHGKNQAPPKVCVAGIEAVGRRLKVTLNEENVKMQKSLQWKTGTLTKFR